MLFWFVSAPFLRANSAMCPWKEVLIKNSRLLTLVGITESGGPLQISSELAFQKG